jgi:alpha-mannosidase
VPPHSPHVFKADTGEYLDQGWQDIRFLIVPHEGDWREPNLAKLSEQFLQPLVVHTESAHSGDLPSTYSAFECEGDCIRIGAMKLAEDCDGIIVRAIEQRGEKSSVKFKITDAEWSANFNPFEIKSFCVENGKVTEVDLLERPI